MSTADRLRHLAARHEVLVSLLGAAVGAWLGGSLAGALPAFVGATLGLGVTTFACSLGVSRHER